MLRESPLSLWERVRVRVSGGNHSEDFAVRPNMRSAYRIHRETMRWNPAGVLAYLCLSPRILKRKLNRMI
jgi:hypothetical protein